MFICSKCGECCKHLNLSELYAGLDRGDGVCKYLKDNLCSIYENRPLICRVDEMYDLYFQTQMDRKTFYQLNSTMCQKLKGEK